MLRALDRIWSGILGIAVALAGLGIFSYVGPIPTDFHISEFIKSGMSITMLIVGVGIFAAFATIIVGAFVLSFRMLRYAFTGKKAERPSVWRKFSFRSGSRPL